MVRTNDHRPAHVHVIFPGGKVDIVVNLRMPLTIREIRGNEKGRDPKDALDAVAANYAELRAKWKKLHGRFS